MTIRVNGEPVELPEPMSIGALLARLDIDALRVAVEHNLSIVKRERYDSTTVVEGDAIEIVNFVGGGSGCAEWQMAKSRRRRQRACGHAEPRTGKSEARHLRKFAAGVGPAASDKCMQ